jgi:type IV pilus assembly protein PilM
LTFSSPKKAIGIDVGTHSVKAVQMSHAGGRLRIEHAGYALLDRNQVNVDPVIAQADAIIQALTQMQTGQSLLVGALAGQTVVIRYPRLNDVPQDQLNRAIETEAGQSIPYDLNEVYLDWSVLERPPTGEGKLKVLLVATKHEVIESRLQVAEAAGIQYGVLSVDSLALADAAESSQFLRPGETVALINIGSSNVSVHFTKDGISNFIRDVSWGARELIQAIAKGRRCDFNEAERLLRSVGEEEPMAAPTMAEEPPAMTLTSEQALGNSLLDPLAEELADLGGSTPAAAVAGAEKDIADLLALPVSRLVSEIRRSFDYYEHQLYEQPVDRIILSGGIAHVPVIRDTLRDELGVETVQIADPTSGAFALGRDSEVQPLLDHPAQFMVAVGLAARGAADL